MTSTGEWCQMMAPRRFDVALESLMLPTKGRIYDLSSGWWPGMPVADAHPPFQVQTFRSPQGMRAENLFPYSEPNVSNYSFISEVVTTTTHAGTHIDALCHVTDGDDDRWHGGHSAKEFLGDAGPLRDDATTLAPILTRGLMLDVPAALGVKELAPSQPIGEAELRAACARQGLTLRAGDAVLIRTGFMRHWPDPDRMNARAQPGLSIDGARWLQSFSPVVIGADNTSIEVSPSIVPGEPQPVHRYLIRYSGIPLLEWVYLEDLACDDVSEFLFACSPLPIRGATGSLVRPLAIV